MTIAEIHGKISHTGSNLSDQMEDLREAPSTPALVSSEPASTAFRECRRLLWSIPSSTSSPEGAQLQLASAPSPDSQQSLCELCDMTEIADRIKITFENVIKIYEESASLLQDADGPMSKAGYRRINTNTVGTEHSKDINSPAWWMAQYVSRYYRPDENPLDLKGLGIVFVDLDNKAVDPVVVLGCFRMKQDAEGKPVGYGYWYLRSGWFSMVPAREMRKVMPIPGKWGFDKGVIQAVPLDGIRDLTSLQSQAIDPLLAMYC